MGETKKVEDGKYSKQFPQLKKILAAFFHEDQFDVFDWNGNPKGYKPIIRYIKSIQDEESLAKKIVQLREFLAISRNWNEDDLEEVLLNDFSGSIYAPFFNLTYQQFLEGTLEILEEPIEKTKSEFIPKFIG